jgi:hypothetical protein
MLLLLSSFLMGWVFSGGDLAGQVAAPLDVSTRRAEVDLAEAVEGPSPSEAAMPPDPAPVQPEPVEAAMPPDPVPVEPEPVEAAMPPDPVPVEPEPVEAAMPPDPAPVEPEPEASVTAPDLAVAPFEEQPIEELSTEGVPVEETVAEVPVAVLSESIPVDVRIKNSVKDGTLTLLLNGEEVHTTPLEKATPNLEAQLEIPPGHHKLAAVAYTAKGKEYKANVEFDLEPGDMRTVQIVAGRTIGKRLTMKMD